MFSYNLENTQSEVEDVYTEVQNLIFTYQKPSASGTLIMNWNLDQELSILETFRKLKILENFNPISVINYREEPVEPNSNTRENIKVDDKEESERVKRNKQRKNFEALSTNFMNMSHKKRSKTLEYLTP